MTTFMEMAEVFFGENMPEQRAALAKAMENSYLEALYSCAWRCDGVSYIFEGKHARPLSEIVALIHEKKGPL